MSDHRVEPSRLGERSGFRGDGGRVGVYGLEITGLRRSDLLNQLPARPAWPGVRVERRTHRGHSASEDSFELGRADVALLEGDRAILDRDRRSATLFTSAPADDGRMVHPFLSVVGAVFGWWLGRDLLHGGALSIGGEGWAVIGDQGSGKSSLLAQMAATGHPVITDDLVAIADGAILAGPRCVDLRPAALDLVDLRQPTQVVRTGDRHRISLGPAPPVAPLRGWIFLSWGSRLRARPLQPGERLRRLSAERSAGRKLLDFAALPGWELERPRNGSLADAAELVVDLAAGAG
jgi:hypothetical protein